MVKSFSQYNKQYIREFAYFLTRNFFKPKKEWKEKNHCSVYREKVSEKAVMIGDASNYGVLAHGASKSAQK